jgi:hypothetical protein
MPKLSLSRILLALLISVAFVAFFWWRRSADEKLGYCETPRETCVNREGIPVGQPCECHGMGGGVFGLDSVGKVIARP